MNPPAANKYRYWTGPASAQTSDQWFAAAAEHPGSWWPLWSAWLTKRSGAEVAPPKPKKTAPAAPGDYVRETLASIADKRGL